MPYTLWHRGVLIGETDFESERGENVANDRPGFHLAGAFRPTAYGRRLLPRMCGILTAAADMKDELNRRGVDPDDMPPEELEDLFENTAAGAHIVDIGRVLSDVELRAPNGRTLPFASMGFLDLSELASLSRRVGCNETMDFHPLPPHAPEFLVSVTLRELAAGFYQ